MAFRPTDPAPVITGDKVKLLRYLRTLRKDWSHDPEVAHSYADRALLLYMGDAAITKAYEAIDKWYA